MWSFSVAVAKRPARAQVLACALAVLLAACGGGSGSNPPAVSPAPLPDVAPTAPEAARFLIQATYGPTMADISALQQQGYAAWLEQQFAQPITDRHFDYFKRKGPIGCSPCSSEGFDAVMESLWQQAARSPDALRQRVVLALSEIFVISIVNSPLEAFPEANASYLDMLARNAFGNYRTLLEDVTLHPAMGKYLSHLQNEKEDPVTGRQPDENYAREVMQLFSIGLWELNEDGTRRLQDGKEIPTYGQAEVMGLAKVLTGWSWGGADASEYRWWGWSPQGELAIRWDLPMQPYAAHHSTAEKKLVRSKTIAAGTSAQASLKTALDTLFMHPNVGPFIGRQLIQRLVTSNPSPAYVARVSQAFANNGQGVRGDMKAVLRAVLLDPEARDASKLADPTWGKQREPVVRFATWLRAFNGRPPSGLYRIQYLENTEWALGQNPLKSPSVFNFFRPDYAPPGDIMAAGLVAPEFQITHETTVTGYSNFMGYVIEHGYGYGADLIRGDYSAELALADRPTSLVYHLDLLLLAGQMTPATRAAVLEAVESITPDMADMRKNRVQIAISLIMTSPEFIVQK